MADFDNRISPVTGYADSKVDEGSAAKDDLDAFSQGESEAEARGGDHRPIQDNGVANRNSNVQGVNTWRGDYPLPVDPHAPPGPPDIATTPRDPETPDEIADFGWNERVEVAQKGNQLQYGVDGPAAGGHGEQGERGEGSFKNRQQ